MVRKLLLAGAATLTLLAATPAMAADIYAFGFSGVGYNNYQAVLQLNGGAASLTAVKQGDVSDTYASPTNPGNYTVGVAASSNFNNFFAFDISGLTAPVSSAALVLDTASINSTVTFSLLDATGKFLSPANPDAALYNALGTGTSFGSFILSSSNSNTLVTFNLNSAGISALNADIAGGQFALGGTLNPVTAPAVPEPGTWAMLLLGFGMMGFAMRRRSNVRTTVSYA